MHEFPTWIISKIFFLFFGKKLFVLLMFHFIRIFLDFSPSPPSSG